MSAATSYYDQQVQVVATATASNENNPRDADATWHAMNLRAWWFTRPLRGGTAAMRATGVTLLPQEPKEDAAAYEVRLQSTFLWAAYDEAVSTHAARPLEREPTLAENVPPEILALADDIDGLGTSLGDLLNDAIDWAIDDGMVHLLIDLPVAGADDTAADDARRRPVLSLVRASSVLGRRYSVTNGRYTLRQVRILESAQEDAGSFGTTTSERVRVYDRSDEGAVTVTVYRLPDGASDWVVDGEPVVLAGVSEIPIRTLYTNRLGFMHAEPALLNLGWKNVEHWQSSSDQRNILHVARVPILFGSGFSKADLEDDDGEVTIGVNRWILASNPSASLGRVQGGSGEIEAGERDLETLKAEMRALAMAPLVENPKSGKRTATEVAIDTSESQSDLKLWVRRTEAWITASLAMAHGWQTGQAVEDLDPYRVRLFTDWRALSPQAVQEMEALKGQIPDELWLKEAKRRGWLDSAVDIEQQVAILQTQRDAAMASMLATTRENMPPDDDDDEDEE